MADEAAEARRAEVRSLYANHPKSGRNSNGTFKAGYVGGPGRPRGERLKDVINGQYAEEPTSFEITQVAEGLGIDEADIPLFDTVQELMAWGFKIRALRGSDAHARELMDRTDPKPTRVDLTADIGSTRAIISNSGDAEGDEYFGRLRGDDKG